MCQRGGGYLASKNDSIPPQNNKEYCQNLHDTRKNSRNAHFSQNAHACKSQDFASATPRNFATNVSQKNHPALLNKNRYKTQSKFCFRATLIAVWLFAFVLFFVAIFLPKYCDVLIGGENYEMKVEAGEHYGITILRCSGGYYLSANKGSWEIGETITLTVCFGDTEIMFVKGCITANGEMKKGILK